MVILNYFAFQSSELNKTVLGIHLATPNVIFHLPAAMATLPHEASTALAAGLPVKHGVQSTCIIKDCPEARKKIGGS